MPGIFSLPLISKSKSHSLILKKQTLFFILLIISLSLFSISISFSHWLCLSPCFSASLSLALLSSRMGCSVSKMEFRLLPHMKIRPPTGTIDEIAIQYSEEQGVEEMKVKVCNEKDAEGGDLGAMVGPSSPSFRVYFRNSFAESEDSEKAKGTSNGMMSGTGMQSSVSKIPNEVLESKLVKKEKGRRLWAFPRSTVAVYSFLHIRSDRRGLLIGKVA